MAVPEYIRKVERPVNTIVDDNGRDGPNRYAVRVRASVRYVKGKKNPQPKNGKVIGHIVDGRYVPVQRKSKNDSGDIKEGALCCSSSKEYSKTPFALSYGSSAFVKSVSSDLFSDLIDVFGAKLAYNIMAVASVQIIKPGICSSRISMFYNRSFISLYYPGAHISINSLTKMYEELGMDFNGKAQFFKKRMEAVAKEHHIAIDGTLIQDNSTVNSLSQYSYKSRVKGSKDISLLYAYDIELQEPICAEAFPGNSIDASSYKAFIHDNNIDKGIIVADKGFPPSKIDSERAKHPDLHFLTPIKRNDSRIKSNNLLSDMKLLKGADGGILYNCKQIKGGRSLYAFKDTRKGAAECRDYLYRASKNNNFEYDKYERKNDLFGLIVFESDMQLDPLVVYQSYADRWLLEMMFRQFKHFECFDTTKVQSDFAVMGKEFVNLISTIITSRLLKSVSKTNLLDKMSFGDLIDDLGTAWRLTDSFNSEKPQSSDDKWVHTLDCVMDELEKLDLSIPDPKPETKKRGRKPKPKVDKPKRPRGRPKKILSTP